jgi:hypothetical protein
MVEETVLVLEEQIDELARRVAETERRLSGLVARLTERGIPERIGLDEKLLQVTLDTGILGKAARLDHRVARETRLREARGREMAQQENRSRDASIAALTTRLSSLEATLR